jgi:hypothetical protein
MSLSKTSRISLKEEIACRKEDLVSLAKSPYLPNNQESLIARKGNKKDELHQLFELDNIKVSINSLTGNTNF